MPVEKGAVVNGKVTGITKFGAFVELDGGGSGLCHISEIADDYVKNVSDFLEERQEVKVKVIEIDSKGKISLSIRQASEKKRESTRTERPERPDRPDKRQSSAPHYEKRDAQPRQARPRRKPESNFRDARKKPKGFEDLLSSYMKDSDDKQRSIKKPKGTRKGNGFNRG